MSAKREGFTHHPIPLKIAKQFVGQEHRHNPKLHAARWALVAYVGRRPCGVVVVGNPKARMLAHPRRAEIVRLATDGTPGACSYLYGAACRVARQMGLWSLKTYTLVAEPGSSLRAVGAKDEGEVEDRSWDRPSRPRTDKHTRARRRRWELLHETAHLITSEAA